MHGGFGVFGDGVGEREFIYRSIVTFSREVLR
jgi:hypothetical protein